MQTLLMERVDRQSLITKTKTDVPAFLIKRDPAKPNRFLARRNDDFFEPTIVPDIVIKYQECLQELVNRHPKLGEFLADASNARMYLDYCSLSDLQLLLAHRVHEDIAPQKSADFLFTYFSAAAKGELLPGKTNVESRARYRKFALEDDKERALRTPKQALILEGRPKSIISRLQAEPSDWRDPDIMIVDDIGYESEAWREVPDMPGKFYPGEKKIIARWQNRIFMFYVSRSHTLKGIEVHQWRNCDAILRGWLAKHNPENLDDVPGIFGLMLDEFIYSGHIQFTKNRDDFQNIRPALNDALFGGKPFSRLTPEVHGQTLVPVGPIPHVTFAGNIVQESL